MLFLRSLVATGRGSAVLRHCCGLASPNRVAYVMDDARDDRLMLKFDLQLKVAETTIVNRSFLFMLQKERTTRDLCDRIVTKVDDALAKKMRKKPLDVELPEIETTVLSATGTPLPPFLSCDTVCQSQNVLRVGGQDFTIVRNAPTLTALRLPKLILRGCPVHAQADVRFCALADCTFQWFLWRGDRTPRDSQKGWRFVGEGPEWVFEDADAVGQWVKVCAVPTAGSHVGLEKTVVSAAPIQDGPTATSPIRKRHAFTQQRTTDPDAFRVVSYNILANLYAQTKFSHEHLFPYCPRAFLYEKYRQPLLLWEIEKYKADLICLQEVDNHFFKDVLYPVWCASGEFEGRHLLKFDKGEGMALFFRRSKFEIVDECSLQSLSQGLFEMKDEAGMEQIVSYVSDNENVSPKWEQPQCLLALVLRCVGDPDRSLLAATTHLFSKPNNDHMRLLQMAVCLKHLEVVKERMSRSGHGNCALLLTGDFNSQPQRGLIKFATEGRLSRDHPDWFCRGLEESQHRPFLAHGLRLKSAYELKDCRFTNYTAMFMDCLDYIFYEPSELQVSSTVPLPPVDDLMKAIALPNEYFPSDHLALIADMRFRK